MKDDCIYLLIRPYYWLPQGLQSELLKKVRDHETLNSEGEALMSSSARDQHVINEELDSINNRWHDLNQG